MPELLHTLHVDLAAATDDRSYPIQIGRGLIADASIWQPMVQGRGVILVTDDQVGPLHGEAVQAALTGASQLTEVVLPAGESHKDMTSIQKILDAALLEKHERGSLFVALGGGVVGDMTGFAAACFMRGADFVQVPTTLLAQVDSSVGGKTGVNHAMGKNLIGAFHQPRQVVIDLDTLATLPAREYAAGLAEIIKYGLIRDAGFFTWLIDNVETLKRREEAALAFAIERSCAIKAAVVAADEREGGVRAHLNFGHTFGHAIERIQGYGDWLHGEAVAAGMVLASRLSVLRGTLDSEVVDQLTRFNQTVGLPVAAPAGVTTQAMLEAMGSDKKVSGGKVRYIVLSQLGEAVVAENVADDDIACVIGA
jgi:3-dehydroquinate synthase